MHFGIVGTETQGNDPSEGNVDANKAIRMYPESARQAGKEQQVHSQQGGVSRSATKGQHGECRNKMVMKE